jgi:hypothetical protein
VNQKENSFSFSFKIAKSILFLPLPLPSLPRIVLWEAISFVYHFSNEIQNAFCIVNFFTSSSAAAAFITQKKNARNENMICS